MKQIFLNAAATFFIVFNFALAQDSGGERFSQIKIQADRPAPGIDLSSYTLITNHPERDRSDAREIMRLKAEWPRAMLTKDKTVFESILSKNFTFRAEDEWYERDAYIRNRVESKEKVLSVRYENLVLQLFGDIAVLSYRNVVNHTNSAGKPSVLHISWADVFVREAGKWKIGASHLISITEMSRENT